MTPAAQRAEDKAALREGIVRLADDAARYKQERDMYRLLYLAALDGLVLVATAPERYEQISRELRKEREQFMAEQFADGEWRR